MALLGLVFAATAGSRGQIVIRGAHSGSHLRLSLEGSRLLVRGQLAHRGQVGCRIRRGEASCPLASAGAIVVETSPVEDKLRVLDRLPVPLTAYLRAGSDKFIGNAEADTCYMQGTPRNRCVGGAGNDVCRMGAGSDGCWGGPGRDACMMGGGEDGCHGEAGDDRLFGGRGADRLYGGANFDHCDGGPQTGRSAGCETGPRR